MALLRRTVNRWDRSRWSISSPPIRCASLAAPVFRTTILQDAPAPIPATEVQQGKLEGSNVPVAEAAMRLVGVMRQFEMLQKAIGVSSDMDTKSIQEVARVAS